MLTHMDACPGPLTVVSTDTWCRRLRVLPYKSMSPRDERLNLSEEQAAAAVSVKEVHSRSRSRSMRRGGRAKQETREH